MCVSFSLICCWSKEKPNEFTQPFRKLANERKDGWNWEGLILEKKYKVRLHGSEFDLEQTKKGIKVNNYQDNDILLDGKIIDFDFKSDPHIQTRKGSIQRKSADIRAAIPGKIVDIRVNEGDEVADQQCLLVLESMKMRNEILSPMAGVIDSISVSIGEQVKSRQLMIKIKLK